MLRFQKLSLLNYLVIHVLKKKVKQTHGNSDEMRVLLVSKLMQTFLNQIETNVLLAVNFNDCNFVLDKIPLKSMSNHGRIMRSERLKKEKIEIVSHSTYGINCFDSKCFLVVVTYCLN